MNLEEALAILDKILQNESLNDVQELVFRQTLEGKTYAEIAEETNYDPDYIKYVGYQLWQVLSKATEEKVTKSNFKSVLRRAIHLKAPLGSTALSPTVRGQNFIDNTEILEKRCLKDWGEAVDVSIFYGRDQELRVLQKWLLQDQCRVILLLGMGGIGKTALSVKMAEQVCEDNEEKNTFEYLVWRSLRNAPPLAEILAEILKKFSYQPDIQLPSTVDSRITQLIDELRKHRCLIVLDNTESILCENPVGYYRKGYEDYGELFKRLGEEWHQSCLVLTSREKPKEFSSLEGEALPVRSLLLEGLTEVPGRKILEKRGLSGTEHEQNELVEQYRGNPLALRIVSTSIHELFNSSISGFLKDGSIVFNGLRSLLDQQFDRLSDIEKKVMYWLAINRDPVYISELKEDIVPPISRSKLLETVEFLGSRSLIEKGTSGFTQQPVVMEYMTEKLIEQLCRELMEEEVPILMNYPLVKAQAKDYVRESQIRVILAPIVDRLKSSFKSLTDIEHMLKHLLLKLQNEYATSSGYAGGNILNLLGQLQIDLTGYDFSNLAIWQAYLQDINLHQVNFARADLSKSVFAEKLGTCMMLKCSPDGKYLAAGETGGVLRMWHVADGKQHLNFSGHANWIWAVAFSPDGKILASASVDKTIKLWDVATGARIGVLHGHEHWVYSVAFSPDGRTIASSGTDQTVRIWNTDTGECLRILQGHHDAVWAVAYSPTGILASGSQDHTVKLWDPGTGQCLKTLEGHTNWAWSIAISPDGKRVASGSQDHTTRIWDVNTGQCLNVLEHPNWVYQIAFSPDSKIIACACKDHMVWLWDVDSGDCTQVLKGHTNLVYSVAFASIRNNPNGLILVSSSQDETIRFWDTHTGQGLKTLQGRTNWILSIALSPEGKIITGCKDYNVRLWDPDTGECLKVLKRHSSLIWSVACSRDGHRIASGSDDNEITLWEAHSGQQLSVLKEHTSIVFCVTFSPDGQTLASGSQDQAVIFWDVLTGRRLRTCEGHTHWVLSVAYAPDGKTLASGSQDGVIKLWDTATGECLQTIQAHSSPLWSVMFSPDGTMLISGSQDTTIKLWDAATGVCLKTLQGHTGVVRSLGFSAEGKIIASGSQDSTIKLWDVATGACLKTLQGHTKTVCSIALDKRNQLISGSQDETVRVWDLSTGECLSSLRSPRLYEGLNITGMTGVTESQKVTLKSLGACDLDTDTVQT
jgi:WD40 repeat protein